MPPTVCPCRLALRGAAGRGTARTMVQRLGIDRRSTRLVVALVFACALLLRLAVPEGWMPVQNAAGWQLTMCDGMATDAMPAMAMDHGHKAPDSDHRKSDMGVCPFAGLGMAMAAPFVPPMLAPAPFLAVAAPLLPGVVAIGRGLAAPPPPPTGPPSID